MVAAMTLLASTDRQTTLGWSVVTSEGLIVLANLTSDEAQVYARELRLRNEVSWEVPMEAAVELQAEWTRLGEVAQSNLKLARMRNVTKYLKEGEVK